MPIYLWTGEEDYLINEKIDMWTDAFKERHGGDMNISVLDSDELDGPEIVSNVESVPFLGTKRLIFIKNLPVQANATLNENKAGMILESLEHNDEANVVVFVQSKPDKRTSFYKKLIKIAKVEEYKTLRHPELQKWVLKRIEEKGAKILPSAIDYLIESAGSNLWRLSNEIDKLVAYTDKKKPISENDIRNVVFSIITSNVFHFLDAVSARDKTKAILEFEKIVEEGESLMQAFSLFINHIRSLILASSYTRDARSLLVSEWNLHPFVAQKITSSVKNFSRDELKNIYKGLLDIDEAVKTGKINISGGNEKLLALEIQKLVLSI